ncbi:MAG: acyltransferase family protein [Cellvibrio sp.]|uniref:acyltransferase family protein n=1 Tax=Cellvibrio sp. TaxID=1965322 RepID=UPI0031A569D8
MSSTELIRPYESERLHYLDNLRALAMIGGVFFHAALAYSPQLHNLWLTADKEQSQVIDIFSWFTHLFRMPVFFVIAGFFVAYLVGKRGMRGMLVNRAKRILLPLVIFLPLCLWAVIATLMSAVASVENKSPVMNFIAYAMANPGTAPPPPVTTLHLWFLYNLVFFCILTWVLSYINWSRIFNIFSTIKPLYFIFGFPLLVLPALLSISSPLPAPDQMLPQLWSFGFFGLFFVLGYWIFRTPQFIERFNPYALALFIGSLVFYAVYYYLMPKQLAFPPAPIEYPLNALLKLCEAYISVWMTLACLVAGKRYLNPHNRVMRFLSDSSYWIYIAHLPLLFAVQYQLMDKDWSLLAKYSASVGVTLVLCIVSYLLFVRWTPIGWMLNGRKKSAAKKDAVLVTS